MSASTVATVYTRRLLSTQWSTVVGLNQGYCKTHIMPFEAHKLWHSGSQSFS